MVARQLGSAANERQAGNTGPDGRDWLTSLGTEQRAVCGAKHLVQGVFCANMCVGAKPRVYACATVVVLSNFLGSGVLSVLDPKMLFGIVCAPSIFGSNGAPQVMLENSWRNNLNKHTRTSMS